MTPEETELITEFKKVSDLMPGVAFDFVMGNLTPDRQEEFGEILVVLGRFLISQAEERRQSALPMTVDDAIGPLEGRSKPPASGAPSQVHRGWC